MTARERSSIDVLTDHVMELKEDMGEVKADVRYLKEAREEKRDEHKTARSILVAIGCVCLGGLPYVAHTYMGWGQG